MSHPDIWQLLEQVGIFISRRDGPDEWGYAINTARLSIDWKGAYPTREETFQAALTWLMNTAIEYLNVPGQEYTHMYTIPREETFQAALTWLMNTAIEYLNVPGQEHTHMYTVPPPAHSAEIFRFELLLESEGIEDTALYDEELMVRLGDAATVVYNEETARCEFQSTLPEYLWRVWGQSDSEGWIFCHPDGRQILVQPGYLFLTIYREVAPILEASRSEDLPG